MPVLDPIEMEYTRRMLAGERVDPSMLYVDQGADPSAGLPPDAMADAGGGGAGGVSDGYDGAGNEPVVVPDAGVGGAPPVAGSGGSGGTLDIEEYSGGGHEGAASAEDPAMAGLPQAPAPRPERAGTTVIEAPLQGTRVPVAPDGPDGPAPWLREYMGSEYAQPEGVDRDPHLPGMPLTPGETRTAQEIEADQYAGVEDQYEAQKYAHEATARAAAVAEEKRQAVELQLREREQARVRKLEDMEANYRRMADRAAAEPIDSDRLWNNKSTGEKILTTLAVAFGAVGQALAGAPNIAFQKLQSDIDRDIEAQKQNKAGKYQRLAEEGSLIGMARERHASEGSIDAAMRETAYRKVAQQLDQFASHVQDPARRAAADQLKAQVDAQILQAAQQRRQGNELYVLRLQQAQAAARGAGKPKDAMFVPGWGYARDPKALEGARGLASANDEIVATIGELRALRKKGAKMGGFGVGTPEYHQATTLRGKLVANVAKAYAAGFNPSQNMEERANEQVLDPTGISDSEFEAKAEALMKMTKNTTESGMKQYIKHRTHPSYKPEDER